jgi:hypothetical protein
MIPSKTLAAVVNGEGLETRSLIAKLAAQVRAERLVVVGLLEERPEPSDRTCSAGLLRDIASARCYSMHLDAPPSDRTCRIDTTGVETACSDLLGQIARADLVVISKFGKLEAAKRGLWPAFVEARDAGKPTLTTVSTPHLAAWSGLAPGSVFLQPNANALSEWWRAVKSTP